MSTDNNANKTVFISYSHADRKYLDDFKRHINPFGNKVEFWDDSRIRPGDIWLNEIEAALNKAGAAVLFLSPDFLNSNFIINKEIPSLLTAAKERGVKVIVIYVSPCSYKRFPDISQYQFINDPNTPVDLIWNKKTQLNALWVRVVDEILNFLLPDGTLIELIPNSTQTEPQKKDRLDTKSANAVNSASVHQIENLPSDSKAVIIETSATLDIIEVEDTKIDKDEKKKISWSESKQLTDSIPRGSLFFAFIAFAIVVTTSAVQGETGDVSVELNFPDNYFLARPVDLYCNSLKPTKICELQDRELTANIRFMTGQKTLFAKIGNNIITPVVQYTFDKSGAYNIKIKLNTDNLKTVGSAVLSKF